MIGDLSHILNLVRSLVAFILGYFTFLSYRKSKSRSKFYLFTTNLGLFIMSLAAFLMLFYEVSVAEIIWRFSSLGAGIAAISFLSLFLELLLIKNNNLKKAFQIYLIIFAITYFFFYVFYPVELVTSATGENDWKPNIIGTISMGLGILISLVLAIYFIFFGIRNKNLKPLLFGLGSASILFGMFFIGLADVERFVFYKLLIIFGLILMFYSRVILK